MLRKASFNQNTENQSCYLRHEWTRTRYRSPPPHAWLHKDHAEYFPQLPGAPHAWFSDCWKVEYHYISAGKCHAPNHKPIRMLAFWPLAARYTRELECVFANHRSMTWSTYPRKTTVQRNLNDICKNRSLSLKLLDRIKTNILPLL